jgi:hypothetical protein
MANLSAILAAKNVGIATGGGGTIIASGNPVFRTYADAQAAVTGGSLDPSIHAFWTSGYYTPGDKGSSFYVDVGSTDPNNPPYPNLVVGEPGLLHDTTNSRYFQLIPKEGELWIEQFGARSVDWLATTYDATPYFYMVMRYILSLGKAHIIRLGGGNWYMSAPFSMKGSNMTVLGLEGSTWLQNASDKPAIVFCPSWGFDADGVNGWQPSVFWQKGEKIGRGATAPAGAMSVYICTTAGTSAATGNGPGGTGTGIVDNTAVWDYVRPMLPEEQSMPNEGEFSVQNLNTYSHWDRGTQPYGKNIGLQGRVRGLIRGCAGENQSGHGIAYIANGDRSFPNSTGNVNGWRIENCFVAYNGWSGYRVGYSDGNAGHGIGLDSTQNGWFGYDDNTFLQSVWVDCQSAYDGSKDSGAVKEHPAACTYNGRWYVARVEQTGLESAPLDYTSTAPDVNPSWVLFYGTGSQTPSVDYPAWTNTMVVEPGGGYCGRDINSRGTWIGCYNELGTFFSQWGGNHIVIGGLINNLALAPARGLILEDGLWRGQLVTDHANVHPTLGARDFSAGIGATFNAYDLTAQFWQDWDGNRFTIGGTSGDGQTHLDYKLTLQGIGTVYELTGTNSLQPYGVGAFRPKNFVMGSDSTLARRRDSMTAAPTSGTWQKGDRVYNANYDGTGTSYWVCSVGGTPGTWVAKT